MYYKNDLTYVLCFTSLPLKIARRKNNFESRRLLLETLFYILQSAYMYFLLEILHFVSFTGFIITEVGSIFCIHSKFLSCMRTIENLNNFKAEQVVEKNE